MYKFVIFVLPIYVINIVVGSELGHPGAVCKRKVLVQPSPLSTVLKVIVPSRIPPRKMLRSDDDAVNVDLTDNPRKAICSLETPAMHYYAYRP